MKQIIKSLLYIGVFFAIQIVIQMIFSVIVVRQGGQSEEDIMNGVMNNILLITIISNALSILLFGLIAKCKGKNLFREIHMTSAGIKVYIISSVVALGYTEIFNLITQNMQFNNTIQINNSVMFYDDFFPCIGKVFAIVALLIAAPFAEEIICRGLVITELRKKFSPQFAVVASAVVFGAMHIMAGGIVLGIGAALMGLICGVIYVKTESLWPAIVAHMFANSIDIINMFL